MQEFIQRKFDLCQKNNVFLVLKILFYKMLCFFKKELYKR